MPERQRQRRDPAHERDAEHDVQDADQALVGDPALARDDRRREENQQSNGARDRHGDGPATSRDSEEREDGHQDDSHRCHLSRVGLRVDEGGGCHGRTVAGSVDGRKGRSGESSIRLRSVRPSWTGDTLSRAPVAQPG